MIRITGNLPDLMTLAENTGSLVALHEKLDYLNNWGEDHDICINVDMFIHKVNLDRIDADVSLKFYKRDDKPATYSQEPKPRMLGGLNLYKQDTERFSWSVNT
jgi:hypothetical protein